VTTTPTSDRLPHRLAGPAAGDPGDAELAARLRLAVTRLHRRLRQQSVGGLTQSQTSALASIGQLEAPTLGELAARESVQPPSMTRIVAGLSELGLVTRVVDPSDRRVARVALTDPGRQVLQRNRFLKNAFLAEQLRRLPSEERERVTELTALLEHLVSRDVP
jgi:DNA-binding MarR family transcriptional regulator